MLVFAILLRSFSPLLQLQTVMREEEMKTTVQMGAVTVHILAPDEKGDGAWWLILEGLEPGGRTKEWSFGGYRMGLAWQLSSRLFDNVKREVVHEHKAEVEAAMVALYRRYRATVPEKGQFDV